MCRFCLICLVLLVATGCGTTRWTDTSRTATEQLLISYAIDSVIEQVNFSVLRGKKVFVATGAIELATDFQYISTALRQHIATNGGLLCDTKDEAEYIVEPRVGAVGTDRNDLLYGIPAITIPAASFNNMGTTGTMIPEIPFVKKTDQRAVCKLAVFVYHRETGSPLWVSGNRQSEGRSKAWWVFGAGPFNKGNIYKGTEFDGGKIPDMIPGMSGNDDEELPPLTVERYFVEPKPLVQTEEETNPPPPEQKAIQYGGITINR